MENPYIKRKMEDTILTYLSKPEIIAIVGARQCGKTTMLKHVFAGLERAVFLTFEDIKVLELFEKHTDEFIKLYIKPYAYVFIDEFQYVKNGGKILKYIFDTSHTKIIISGSSAVDLTVHAVKYLVGRIFVMTMYPLDFGEYLRFRHSQLWTQYAESRIDFARGIPKHPKVPEGIAQLLVEPFIEYAIFGGYPRVALAERFEEKIEVLKNIYNTYFLREVKDILGVIDDYKLADLIKALALQVGNLVAYRELSGISGLAHPTLKKYLNFLEKTYISFAVRPYHKNKRTEIVKNPKVYFFDTGLRNYIANDFRGLTERTDAGALLENAVAQQLLKQNLLPYFWRTKRKEELDFVVELPDKALIALECKTTLSMPLQESGSARAFRRAFPGIPLAYLYLKKRGTVAANTANHFWPVALL